MNEKTVDTDGVDVLIICGVKYAVPVFEVFGIAPIGTVLKIVSRADGVLVLKQM